MADAGCPWPAPRYRESTGSTNADAAVLAAEGAVDGTCVVAGEQTAGRGRHDRRWISDPGAGLWSSTIIRECDHPAHLPLLAALAVVDVGRDVGGVSLAIKWPNDVLDGADRKLAGILVEMVAGASIVGIGMNIERPPAEVAHAGSWVGAVGRNPDRSVVLAGLLVALHDRIRQPWNEVLSDYRSLCRTIGRRVHVALPSGEAFAAMAMDVTQEGHLLVDTGSTSRIIIAGDVLHATIAP